MIGKILWLLSFIALVIAGYYVYENLPGDAVSLIINGNQPMAGKVVYGDTPMFMDKLRFPMTNISYYVEKTCSEARRDKMIEAFNIFQEQMVIVSFYEDDYQNADILVGCSNNYIDMGENLFAAGEGGPSHIINTTNYKVILSGKISLYKKSDCKYPVVELHELGHVFGFDHSLDKKNIMYNVSNCDQRITSDMIFTMNKLYSVKPLPDLEISSISAVKSGRYLNFNITVTNTGLLDAKNVSMTLFADDLEFQSVDLKEIGVGYGRILSAENIKLPSRDIKNVKFYVDYDNSIEELDDNNNFLTLTPNQ